MMKRKISAFGLALVFVLGTFSGCSKAEVVDDYVELVDPVGVTANYVAASRQDLVVSHTYIGKVVPTVEEVSFASGQNFSRYGALPGSYVSAGDAIILASTENIDNQIKALKERIKYAKENYDETIKGYNSDLEITKKSLEYNKSILDKFAAMTTAEKNAYHSNLGTNTGAYSEFYFENEYKNDLAAIQKLEQNIKKTTELYLLDAEYNNKSLKNLNSDKSNVLATAPISGTVVAAGFFDNNQYINKNVSVAAVGNFDKLIVKSEVVYKSDVKKAEDVYAIVNGKRYETSFVASEINSYIQTQYGAPTTTVGGSYSTFTIDDPNGEVKAGDTATIVLINSVKKDALCVPSDAVNTDADGSFVYIFDGEKNNYVPVKTGIKNGFYTEILSGINEGDLVVSEFVVKAKTRQTKLSMGKIGSSFKGTGYIFYPKSENITNTVEYGTAYIDELLVTRYQQVEKGQVIAKVHVTADDIAIKRLERQILRANESLEELVELDREKKKLDADDTTYDKMIKLSQDDIAEMNKTLKKMKSDAKVTEITAPYSGIITGTGYFDAGDILFNNAYICSLAAEENCFIAVEDKNGQLTVGNKANVAYYDAETNSQKEAIGDVVTVSNWNLSSDLNTEYSLIRVSNEDFSKMAGARGNNGWWSRASFTVTADVRTTDNVLLVPKLAVTTSNEVNYVTMVDENGNYYYKSFVAGGSDSTNYWVIDGLSEGTTICLE